MSAATASRNYGGSATQTMTAPHHQLYPTPHSSTGTVNSSRTTGTAANAQQIPRGAYGYPSSSSATKHASKPAAAAGSWSILKEGDKQIIVIEDTPEPEAGSSTAIANTTTTSRPSTANVSSKSKKARTNGYNPTDGYLVNNLHYPPPNPAGPSSSSAYAAPSYAVAPAKASASSSKRKYNEVNDPAAAVSYLCFMP